MTDRTDWARLRAMRDEDIACDADNPRTTRADWAGAVIKVNGKAIGHTPGRGELARAPAGQPGLLDVLERWRATGPGWQTRMAQALDRALPA